MNLFSTNIAYASVDSFVANVDRLIINPLIIFLFALALAFFLYGVFEFILNQDNDEKKTQGKSHMIWGIIGLTIMFGVWTILGVVMRTFNIGGINPKKGEVKLNDYSPTLNELKN